MVWKTGGNSWKKLSIESTLLCCGYENKDVKHLHCVNGIVEVENKIDHLF